MPYDPRQCGAQCDICPLKENKVVPPEWGNSLSPSGVSDSSIALIGEAPSEEEERTGRPFTGRAGEELDVTMHLAGLRRKDVLITNVLLCKPPKGKLKDMLTLINKENKRKEKNYKIACEEASKAGLSAPPKPDYTPSPIDCCKPRLQNELSKFKNFITLGGVATKALTGSEASITAIRGGFMDLENPVRRVMPTFHPSFVIHKPRYIHVMRNDFFKAVRWFRGVAQWNPPEMVWHPSAQQIRDFLNERKGRILAYDLETDGIEPLTANIRCLAIGDAEKALAIAIMSKKRVDPFGNELKFVKGEKYVKGIDYSHPRFYTPDEEVEVIAALKEYFEDPREKKYGWNVINYDATVLRHHWGIEVKNQIDGIILHKSAESEMPHGLGYVGSLYTEVPAWKCYDNQTEVLTKNGWVRFDKLERGVEVAQWDNGVISFVVPVAYVDQPYSGVMWYLENQATNLMVTPDHKMIYKTRLTEIIKECEVQNLPMNGLLPHVGMFKEGSVDFTDFDIDFIRLIVAFQADGTWAWAGRDKEGVPSYLDFGFTKQRKIDRLKSILSNLGMSYIEKSTGSVNPRTRIWVNNHPYIDQLWLLLGRLKCFGSWLLNIPLNQRLAFLEELPYWDGTSGKTHNNYNTMIQSNADWVQACAAISGVVSRTKVYDKCWRVCLPSGKVRSRNWSRLDSLPRKQVSYEGRIYCVSVPTGFILVRRGGKITISGNTDRDGNKLAFGSETDDELLRYCVTDTAVTYSVLSPILTQVQLRDQLDVFKFDSRIQEVCSAMHEVGMYVDQNKRLAIEHKMLKRRQSLLKQIRDGLGLPNFNPGSTQQVRDVLFDKWHIELPLHDKDRLTGSGDPSTSDLVLRTILTDRSVPKDQREIVKLMRYFRKIQKVLGTYVTKLRYNNVEIDSDLRWDDEDEDFADKALREQYGLAKMGIVNPLTNRMHPGWSSVPPVTGRLSSSKPINAMNFAKTLRSMVTCQPGHVLVGADSEQIEVRVAAAWWQIEKYLLAFREQKDVHSMSTYMIFGKAFCQAAGIDEKYFLGPGKLVGAAYNEQGTFIGKGNAANLRKLGKIVHLACIAAHEPVAVLDSRRRVPISELKPGDWVWSWSIQRKRYEPTKVVRAWSTGKKKCITIGLAKGNGDRWESSITLTPNHPVMSRDGTFKHVDMLNIDDRLMPFFRSDSESGRSTLSPFNDERRIAEPRVICGIYDTDSTIHVHHKDENTLNNVPSNLSLLTPSEHHAERCDAQKETRLAPDSIWRQRMSAEEVRLKKAFLMKARWLELKAADPEYGKGRRGSILDDYLPFIGYYTDQEIADKAGCTRALVGLYRKERDIPPPPAQRGGLRHLLLNNPEWRRLFFTLSNEEIADLVNKEFGTNYTRQAVYAIRNSMDRPEVEKTVKAKVSKIDDFAHLVGHEIDSIVAEKAGTSSFAVRRYRETRGIPEYWKDKLKLAENHRVVSIKEESEEFEVWDIEVEHEDHNFALACGIFVHNSQYMAGVEQVHKIIQSTEVPAKDENGKEAEDGTTELPYALMPLPEVREMHEKWMKGAPEYAVGWERDINQFKNHGYLREPVNGRRRDFLDSLHGTADDLAPNEIVNFSVQSAAAAIIGHSMLQIYEQIPKNMWGPGTGIINQCHDHIVVECPEDKADWVRGVIEEAMNHTHSALPGVKFAATAEVGKSWDKV